MKIVTIPHPALRQQAAPVTHFNDEFFGFIDQLQQTLSHTKNPKGVGLAAPQVNTPVRIFATAISDEKEANNEPEIFINPTIVKHSDNHTFGPDPESPRLEGCLSMPLLYGPVPRWEWVEVEYQTIREGEIAEKKQRFDGFHARVIQHETDHLDGILFTDYSLEYDLPVYREEKNELLEITDRGVLELY